MDANVALVHVNKKERHQKMRANKMDTKEQVRGLGDAYVRRKWRSSASFGEAPAKDCGGLGRGVVRGVREMEEGSEAIL